MGTIDHLLLDSLIVATLSWIALFFQKEKLGELRIFIKIFLFIGMGSAALIIIIKVVNFIINLTSN